MKRLSDQTLYEILEVSVEALPEEIERACTRAAALYGPGSLATYTLMSPDEAALLTNRIEEARAVLLDPDARARYDERIGVRPKATPAPLATPPPLATPVSAGPIATPWPPPQVPYAAPVSEWPAAAPPEAPLEPAPVAPLAEAQPPAEPPAVPPAVSQFTPPTQESLPLQLTELAASAPAPGAAALPPEPPASPGLAALTASPVAPPSPPAPPPIPLKQELPPPRELVVPEGSPWTGEMLRQVREARGLTIRQISDRTKVIRHHIENIEAEKYDALPAPVYLRGILTSLARELRLDGQRVARSFLERLEAAQAGANAKKVPPSRRP